MRGKTFRFRFVLQHLGNTRSIWEQSPLAAVSSVSTPPHEMPEPTPLTLALDWTPNTNHTGFYVAQANGWYREAGLDVRIEHPGDDNYATTPARKVAQGKADLAIAPSESVLSYRTTDEPVPLVAIAAVLARDASAVVTLASSGLDRPSALAGRTYASYQARFEDAIVQSMVRVDGGGSGDVQICYPPKLGIWDTLLQGDADATWIFDPWEGVQADRAGVDLNRFVLSDYGIPYGYSPVLVARADRVEQKADAIRAFLSASRRGFTFASKEPDAAADLLIQEADHSTLADADFVRQSQHIIAPYYADDGKPWGEMRVNVWESFVGWIADHGLIVDTSGTAIAAPDVSTLFTNDLLSASDSA